MTVNSYHRLLLIPSIEIAIEDIDGGVSTLAAVLTLLVLVEVKSLLAFTATIHNVSKAETDEGNFTHKNSETVSRAMTVINGR